MNNTLTAIETALQCHVVQTKHISGGDTVRTALIELSDGQRCFLKCVNSPMLLQCEVNGLQELRKANTIRVAEVLYSDNACLLLEWIDTGNKNNDFYERFGTALAQLHRHHAPDFGFFEDNFIGLNPQGNLASVLEKKNWPLFYWNKRMLPQIRLAERNGMLSPGLRRDLASLENKIEQILDFPYEEPSLLHGDLWVGNYIVSASAEPILIDPAVYYGHRETDLAMTQLFGGFRPEFYEAYQATWPLAAGADYRMPLYQLYHVLNHLNLFGLSYINQAQQLTRFYL